MYPTSGIALPTCHFGRYWWGPSYIEKIWKNRKRSLEIRATHQWSTLLYGEHLDKSSSIDPSVQAVRTFASTDSERGYPRVQWISGGGCVLVTSFLTCHLLLQLFELDIFPFDSVGCFSCLTCPKIKIKLKKSEKRALRGLQKSELIFDCALREQTFCACNFSFWVRRLFLFSNLSKT